MRQRARRHRVDLGGNPVAMITPWSIGSVQTNQQMVAGAGRGDIRQPDLLRHGVRLFLLLEDSIAGCL